MKKNNTYVLILLSFWIFSCNPKISTSVLNQMPALEENAEILVTKNKEEIPSQHEVIGSVKIRDTGFTTNCSYPVVIDAAKSEARKIGGNTLFITNHQTPNLMSSCHQINANIISATLEPNEGLVELGELQSTTQPRTETPIDSTPSLNKKWRLAFQGGFSFRTAKVIDNVSSDYKSYLQKLKKGFHLGGDINYFPNGNDFGFGVKYNFFSSQNAGDFYFEDDNFNLVNISIEDNITINYVGPSFLLRYPSSRNLNSGYLGVSLGYLSYQDRAQYFDEFTIKGQTLGAAFDFGYDIATSDEMAIGFQISIVGGVLHKIKIERDSGTEVIELDDNSKESLSRIDLSIGIRF